MQYDLIVVGGGIIGTGIARDAALRGVRVALFEKEDFASGTTSRSTRIIHGGLRYLEQLDFGLVYEALHERKRLLKNAPHLVQPLEFLFPSYRKRGHPYSVLWAGIGLYDLLNLRRGMPHHKALTKRQAMRLEPALKPDGLKGGFIYFDGQCEFPERVCIENVVDAAAHGARIENHARVVSFLRSGDRIRGVRVRRESTGEEYDVEAPIVVNAAGPWLDEVERLAEPTAPERLRRTKGVHLAVPRFTQHALIMEASDGRIFFAIPWGEHTLLGTTDTDYDGPNETVSATQEDVDYLLREIKATLEVRLTAEDVRYTTAGLRPLRRQVGRATGDISRKHEFIDHESTDGRAGLITVVGGKITTFRNIAEEAVDLVFAKLGRRAPPSPTREKPLPGAAVLDFEKFRRAFREEAIDAGLQREIVDQWLRVYGVRSRALLNLCLEAPEAARPIAPGRPYTTAEAIFACEQEFCDGLTDFMLRRSMWGLFPDQGLPARDAVLDVLASQLDWGPERREAESRAYHATLARMRSAALPRVAAQTNVYP